MHALPKYIRDSGRRSTIDPEFLSWHSIRIAGRVVRVFMARLERSDSDSYLRVEPGVDIGL